MIGHLLVLSLQAHLLGLVSDRRTLRLQLTSGHELELRLTSGGTNWIGGETMTTLAAGAEPLGAVIPVSSIACIRGGGQNGESEALPQSNPQPLQVMVASLVGLRKPVTVFGVSNRWNGVLRESAQDYVVLAMTQGEPVLVPHEALSWISIR
jgi:hypothetical protein